MSEKKINLTVYGAEVKCASCVNAPGSKETFEWLQAAITRKYGENKVSYYYYDLHEENQPGVDEQLVDRLREEELFYPLVLVEDEIVGEGNPRLKSIYQALESRGIEA
ncbi:YuzD family protein [Halobacillus sp. K22]|uniref:YuzD family protein n=1 Tax=Halobacillus sp. K22 TaxID=3457431 RepID=UPI003FCDE7E8